MPRRIERRTSKYKEFRDLVGPQESRVLYNCTETHGTVDKVVSYSIAV